MVDQGIGCGKLYSCNDLGYDLILGESLLAHVSVRGIKKCMNLGINSVSYGFPRISDILFIDLTQGGNLDFFSLDSYTREEATGKPASTTSTPRFTRRSAILSFFD